jgi:hypothetical protein
VERLRVGVRCHGGRVSYRLKSNSSDRTCLKISFLTSEKGDLPWESPRLERCWIEASVVSLLLFLMNRRRSTIAYLQGRTTPSALAEHATIFLFCSCCVAGSVSLSRPQVSSPLASGRHRERSPARDRVSYDDRRIAFSYACVGAVAVQDARARDRRPNSSLCRRVSHHYTSPCRRERHPTRDRMSYITMCRASRCCMCPRASGQDARAEDRRTHGPRSTKEVR